MKKLIGIFVCLIFILTACSSNETKTTTEATTTPAPTNIVKATSPSLMETIDISSSPFKKGYYDYSGTINGNLKIKMSVYQLKNELVGTYFYDSQRIELRLQGQAGGNRIVLFEYDESGNNTGVFIGSFATVDKIDGTWTSADDTRSYPFVLELSSNLPNAEYGKRYAVTLSTKNDTDVNKFVDQLQQYVINGDREKIADLITYPINVNIYGQTSKIKDKQDFIEYYDKIFTSSFKEAIKNAYTRYLFANWQGVMFGENAYNIWINEINSELTIIGINNLK